MIDILKLGCGVLTSILKQDLSTAWVFEASHVVYFAINKKPARLLGIVLKDIIEVFEDATLSSFLSHFDAFNSWDED